MISQDHSLKENGPTKTLDKMLNMEKRKQYVIYIVSEIHKIGNCAIVTLKAFLPVYPENSYWKVI